MEPGINGIISLKFIQKQRYILNQMEGRMMDIACLGWGSLVWDPRTIPIRGKWFDDGPILPIEFARESSNGRITLVIADVDFRVRSLWALMSVTNLDDAKAELAVREGIPEKYIKYSIGFWDRESRNSHGRSAAEIGLWAEKHNLDGAVWTNLKFGFKNNPDFMPTYADILEHLRSLPHEKRRVAEEYIRQAPIQIDTDYRRRIQDDLVWLPTYSENA